MRDKGILIGNDFVPKVTVRKDADGIITGGLVLGNTLYQNQALLCLFRPGYVKLAPKIGVGVDDMPLDRDFNFWKQRIRKQLELDGQKVTKIIINDSGIQIDAKYRG